MPLRGFARAQKEVQRMRSEYDLPSAVTFLLIGLGIGSVLAIVFNPGQLGALEGINSRRAAKMQSKEEAKEQTA
jgi:hypothetical protein